MNRIASDGPVLEASGLTRAFRSGESRLEVLRGIDLQVERAEVVAVVGPSGSGKSTLLHCLGGLDRPNSGTVQVRGVDLAGLNDARLAQLRNREIGFVFQFHHLLPDFTALENVMLPTMIGGSGQAEAVRRAQELLGEVGLAERLHHAPGELSGGEQQRVAVARALANDPAIVLADEPSGNLDVASSGSLHDLLTELRDRRRTTFVIATHDAQLARRADRVLVMGEGLLHDGADVATQEWVAGATPGVQTFHEL